MKKALAFLLVPALCLALAVPALAAGAVRSPQNLVCNGYGVDCEKYNIGGSNYFKLRDLAALLSDTASRFSVGWDAARGVVTVTSGEDYRSVGTELEIGPDASASAVPSAQTIRIDGAVRSELSVYNIGGNNYFKLRDLGAALGFSVAFDPDSNTAVVESAPAASRLVKQVSTTDGQRSVCTYSYDENGRLTGYAADDGSSSAKALYNAYGVIVETEYSAYDADSGFSYYSNATYTGSGKPLSEYFSNTDNEVSTTSYTYDRSGALASMSASQTFANGDGSSAYATYNANGDILTVTSKNTTGDYTIEETTKNSYDTAGRLLTSECTSVSEGFGYDYETDDFTGAPYRWTYTYKTTCSYNAAGLLARSVVVSASTQEEGGVKRVNETETTTTDYLYNAAGSVLRETVVNDGTDAGTTVTEYTYDAAQRCLSETCRSSGETEPLYTETYAYDAAGNLLTRLSDAYGSRTEERCTYTSDGRLLTQVTSYSYTDYDWETGAELPVTSRSSTAYDYDAAGRVTRITTTGTEGESLVEMTYDGDGNLLLEKMTSSDFGSWSNEYTYDPVK